MTTSTNLLGPVLVRSQQNYLGLLLIVRYFETPRAAATLRREEAGTKINDIFTRYRILEYIFLQKQGN